MSGTAPQLARPIPNDVQPKARSALAHLLHALNQPLTGLQCALELAVSGPRSTERYVRTLSEGLELAARMRILVEAIRELTDMQEEGPKAGEVFFLNALLRETAEDLRPVAEERKVQLRMASDVPLRVHSSGGQPAALMFRLLESALSLAGEGSELGLSARHEGERAILAVSWKQATPPEHSPFSRAELGLLIAQAGWERAGAEWTRADAGNTRTCTIRLPLDSLPSYHGAGAGSVK